MNESANEENPCAAIGSFCTNYVRSIESMAESLPLIMLVLHASESNCDSELEKFIDAHAIDVEKTTSRHQYAIRVEHKSEHDELYRSLRIYRESMSVTPRSYLVSLVSAYDAFLGRLIRHFFKTKPELHNATDCKLTLPKLIDLGSVDAAREHFVEKEVSDVLRKSHSKQFDWLEKVFSIKLGIDLECWPLFIEITERRNLFVHVDGIVGTQYIAVCRDHSFPLKEEIAVGTKLSVSPSYFKQSAHCLLEIGVKLAHVLWRKLAPDERKEADENLISIIYDLLLKKEYRLANVLSEFGTETLKRHASDELRRIMIVNRAIACSFGGELEKCSSILDAEDWSSTADKFQLSVAVLRGNFGSAAEIMRTIGKDNQPRPFEYREWPVFKDFRKSEEFARAYNDVFGQEFLLQEPRQDGFGKKESENGAPL